MAYYIYHKNPLIYHTWMAPDFFRHLLGVAPSTFHDVFVFSKWSTDHRKLTLNAIPQNQWLEDCFLKWSLFRRHVHFRGGVRLEQEENR